MNNLFSHFDNWITEKCLDIYDVVTSFMAAFEYELYKQLDLKAKNG